MYLTNLKMLVPDCYTKDHTDFVVAMDALSGAIQTTTLAAGTKVVTDSNIKSTSKIWYQRGAPGGTLGHLSYTIINGTSFTFLSSSGTDTSVIEYSIVY